MAEHCAHTRFVWNLALEQANCYQPHRGNTPNNAQRMRQLTEARAGSWLGEGSTVVQQAALRDFDQALRNWWAGTHRRPRWRKMGEHEGFAIRDLSVRKLSRKWATVVVPKLGSASVRLSRPLPPATKSARVTMDRAGRWHVSFTAVPEPIEGPGTGEVVGVDRGVVVPFQCSDGTSYAVPGLSSAAKARKRRLQRRLARQRKGSNRRSCTKTKIAKLAVRDADRRKDSIEKSTTDLARRFDLIRVENLNVRNMVRSAKGTPESPGRNVRAKAGLNRSIGERAWSMWLRRLEDKAAGRVEKVNAAYTSQRCNACGHTAPGNRESQAVFRCESCGHTVNADVNAAQNIAAGRAVSGRGGNRAVRRPDEASSTRVA